MRDPSGRGRRRARAAVVGLVACALLAAGCEAATETAEPKAGEPPSTEAPLIPEESALPSVDVQELLEQDMSDLAAQAERIAGRTPPQRRPSPIRVAAGSTRWQVGAGYRGIFADPDLVRHRGTWFAYATNTSHQAMPVLASKDLVHWSAVGDALPAPADWVVDRDGGRGLWAPSVAGVGGGWTAAYSARAGTMGGIRHNCIGLARGSSPTGPFRPTGEPLCYGVAQHGVIDPDLFVDDQGTPWLLWKFSGITNRRPAGIFIRQLGPDGAGFAEDSETHELLKLEDRWEVPTIENPSMVQFRGVTYLFYSGNRWENGDYATGYAICAGPAGPCTRPKNGSPFLTTAETGHPGPGGASAFVHQDSLRLLYHAWDVGQVGRLRTLHVAGLWQREDGTLDLVDPG
ncbi:MAG TPA: glycoside hydrolase family 43 protein [Acidimicrobiales bacterium]